MPAISFPGRNISDGLPFDDLVFLPWRINKARTYGTRDQATGASVLVNVADDRQAEVLGFTDPSQLAIYTDRDSVSFYVHNEAPPLLATLSVASYTATSAVLASPLSAGTREKMRAGMIVDTADTPKFSGIITGWAVDGTSVTVSGWYQVGNTSAGQIPAASTALLNPITKVWGHNANVALNADSYGDAATGFELGVLNNKAQYNGVTGPRATGMDVVSLGAYRGDAAFQQRGAFLNGFVSTGKCYNAGFLVAHGGAGNNPYHGFLSQMESGLHYASANAGYYTFAVRTTGVIDIGSWGQVSSPAVAFHSSGLASANSQIWDAQITASGGDTTQGNGTLKHTASEHIFTSSAGARDLSIRDGGGQSVVMRTQGSASKVYLAIATKGFGSVGLACISDIGNEALRATPVSGQVNAVEVQGAATGASPIVHTIGSDANIRLSLQGKGTGGVQIEASGGALGFFGATPIARKTGYGTPTNVSKVASISGTSATLADVGGTLAALIADLKDHGLIAA